MFIKLQKENNKIIRHLWQIIIPTRSRLTCAQAHELLKLLKTSSCWRESSSCLWSRALTFNSCSSWYGRPINRLRSPSQVTHTITILNMWQSNVGGWQCTWQCLSGPRTSRKTWLGTLPYESPLSTTVSTWEATLESILVYMLNLISSINAYLKTNKF